VADVQQHQTSVATTVESGDSSGSGSAGVCEDSADGVQPQVELMVGSDNTAVLSWCEVTDAEGYNLFVGNQLWVHVQFADLHTTVSYTGTGYMVGWYADTTRRNLPFVHRRTGSADENTLASIDIRYRSKSERRGESTATRHAENDQLARQDDGSFIEVLVSRSVPNLNIKVSCG
jgi:hypothetical protein